MRIIFLFQLLYLTFAPHPPCECEQYENGAELHLELCLEYELEIDKNVCYLEDEENFTCKVNREWCDNII